MTLATYLERVDIALVALCGLGIDELPDWRYALDYEDGYSPKACAKRAIAYAGGI